MNRAKCVKRLFIRVASQGACESDASEQVDEEIVTESSQIELPNRKTPQGILRIFKRDTCSSASKNLVVAVLV